LLPLSKKVGKTQEGGPERFFQQKRNVIYGGKSGIGVAGNNLDGAN
jgi:hypothetical protein